MFDHITAARPNVLVTSRRGDYKAVATFTFNAAGQRTSNVGMRMIARADGQPLSAQQRTIANWTSTLQDVRANIESGMFELGYACTTDGGRLEPVTGEQWTTICNNVRETRVAVSVAQNAVAAARETLNTAEAALLAANTAATAAQSVFNSAI
ncbi:MAG: hypothetical protein RR877_10075 [Aurantimicrobium sp.]|uniref:hypothetical protein n=1 Tax=Aurantimicrobium sp. TaxID=1930784 RepID=UPI002FC6038B